MEVWYILTLFAFYTDTKLVKSFSCEPDSVKVFVPLIVFCSFSINNSIPSLKLFVQELVVIGVRQRDLNGVNFVECVDLCRNSPL